MNFIGYRLIPIASLLLPGDMRIREQAARVQALAETYAQVGTLHAPVVRWVPTADRQQNHEHNRVLAGRDRIAAHMLIGSTELEVRYVECTDEEARRIELIENAHRRHDRGEQATALKALQEVLRVAEEQLIEQMGRQPTRREVHAAAAPVLGVLPETVARKEREVKATNGKRKPTSGLETWGLELDDAWHENLTKLTVAMESLAGSVTKALAASAFLQDNQLVTPAFAANVRQELASLSRIIRDNQPVALCPYCKGQEELQDKCGCCIGTGWVGPSKLRSAPEPLKDAKNLKVARAGELRTLSVQMNEPDDESVKEHLRSSELPKGGMPKPESEAAEATGLRPTEVDQANVNARKSEDVTAGRDPHSNQPANDTESEWW
jgi:ParB-like chromosome segregation protein Spo0J